MAYKKKVKKKSSKNSKKKNISKKHIPTLKIIKEDEIAMDFALKAYKKFEKAIKSIILFGSSAKKTSVTGSDIDIILIIDDASIKWDQEMIAWYREELEKILEANPYQKNLHINTIKITTWWEDLLRGDPVILNVLRYGEALVDLGGFFDPLKHLLIQGKIKSTPEAIYTSLERAPIHFQRSKVAELNAIEGLYWAMADASQAALMSAGVAPPSPENIPDNLQETFVSKGMLNKKYVVWMRELLFLHKDIMHRKVQELEGAKIDEYQAKTDEFIKVMIGLVKDIVESN